MDASVPHLAAHYYRFKFESINARSVFLDNTLADGNWPTAHVYTLAKIEGQWRAAEDITGKRGEIFCRDTKAERIEELLVIFSNSEWQNRKHVLRPAQQPNLLVTNVGCWRWQGTARLKYTYHDDPSVHDEIMVMRAVFERSGIPYIDLQAGRSPTIERYDRVSSALDWSYQGKNGIGGSCIDTGGPVTFPLPVNSNHLVISTYTADHWYDGEGGTSFPTTIHSTCTPFEREGYAVWDFLPKQTILGKTIIKRPLFLSRDGVIQGNVLASLAEVGGTDVTVEWHFEPLRE